MAGLRGPAYRESLGPPAGLRPARGIHRSLEAGPLVDDAPPAGGKQQGRRLQGPSTGLAADHELAVLGERFLHHGEEVGVRAHALRTQVGQGDVVGALGVAGLELRHRAHVHVGVRFLLDRRQGLLGRDALNVHRTDLPGSYSTRASRTRATPSAKTAGSGSRLRTRWASRGKSKK